LKVKAKETSTPSVPALRYDYKAFAAELGARIRQLRKSSGLTLRALQLEHNYHLSQIQRTEKGEGISLPTLLRIAETYQVPVERLVEGLGLVSEPVEARSKTGKK
jgi:transcriptional regulator with XRE-family HTH domain